jgi:hypothetical protein
MSVGPDEDLRWLRPEEAALIERLRALEWPEPDPSVKQRCWREFRARLSDREAEHSRADAGRTYDFSRRPAGSLGRSIVAAHRMAAARGLSRPRREGTLSGLSRPRRELALTR